MLPVCHMNAVKSVTYTHRTSSDPVVRAMLMAAIQTLGINRMLDAFPAP